MPTISQAQGVEWLVPGLPPHQDQDKDAHMPTCDSFHDLKAAPLDDKGLSESLLAPQEVMLLGKDS